MLVSVFGAEGLLGRDVVAVAEQAEHEVIAYGHSDVDVADRARVERRLGLDGPDAVINCAAWTDVDGAEDDPEGAFRVNRDGATNVASEAAVIGAKVLYVSTDYVFDGTKGSDYVETDRANPISVYGASKLAGEAGTAGANRRSFVVRTAWLYGTGGSNFVDSMISLGRAQRQVLATRDQVGSPTYSWHAAHGLVRMLDSAEFGLHHLAGSGRCSRYEFAREIFRLACPEATVLSATSDLFNDRARRPAWSALATEREHAIRLPDWREGLAQYIRQRDKSAESKS